MLFTNKVFATFVSSQIIYICAVAWWIFTNHILQIFKLK